MRQNSHPIGSDRAVSEVVGAALLLALVVAAVGATAAVASTQLSGSEVRIDSAGLVDEFVALDGVVASVTTGADRTRIVELSSGYRGRDAGVRLRDATRLTVVVDGAPVVRTTIGRVSASTRDGGAVVYEGGAVFRVADGGGVRVVDGPPFSFTETVDGRPTVTLGVYDLEGAAEGSVGRSGTLAGTVRVSRRSRSTPYRRVFVRESVTITVRTPYVDGWASVLAESAPGGTLAVDREANTVTLSVSSPEGLYLHLHRYRITVRG
jgi:flagellin-like protein